ncbi:MAG: hypothetical protein PHD93_01365 [Candidatus Pacebacteria bacterium]|nr:hypothetical protein [Candidatus Paceibacterota bacterium]
MKIFLEIATVSVKLEIDDDLRLIIEILKNFKICRKHNKSLNIKIKKNIKNSITLSSDYNDLLIGIDEKDSPYDYFNLMGVLQAIFRFIGLHSVKNDVFLIHGSASVYKGKGFCFSDDGSSVGKTLSAIELSLVSNKIIGDEFCFLNVKTMEIFSYPFIPLHIRPEVEDHLDKIHKIHFKENFIKTKAGIFLMPKALFDVEKRCKLDYFVFVHFNKEKNICEKMNQVKSQIAIKNSLLSHLLKLINPSLDRMNFIDKKDSSRMVTYNYEEMERLEKDIIPQGIIDLIIQNINCYKVNLKNPCNLIDVLQKIK